jgi:flagellin-like hook-associated protein FlgL
MARIGSALTGIERRLLDSLALANAEVTLSAYRMATGRKINAAGDDPSAFVTLSGLQSQLNTVSAALANVTAAGSLVVQTQTALSAMKTQLNLIRTELLKDADPAHPLTPDQRAESQAKIDAAVNQINALARTSANGKTPLAGGADYRYSGRNAGQVSYVLARGNTAPGTTISGAVSSTATQAEEKYSGSASHQITADATFTLSGKRGSQVIAVEQDEALSDVAAEINAGSYLTGITAAVDEVNDKLVFTSVGYGSDAIINIEVTDGTFDIDVGGHPTGTNASAIINGVTIESSSNKVSGNRFFVNNNGATFEIEFQSGFTGDFDTITIEGSALRFSMATDLNYPSGLSIPAMFAANLSGPSGRLDELYSGGPLSGLGANTAQAIRVVDEALGKVTRVKGSVDGFYNAAVASSSNLLTDMQTKLGDYIDSIDKTNDDEETLRQDYYQALADNAVAGLAIVNQQRMSIVKMLQDIAGLD